jgi:hypothetical protein
MGDKPKPRQFCGGGKGGEGLCVEGLRVARCGCNLLAVCLMRPKGVVKKRWQKSKSRLRRGTADEIDASAPKKLEDRCSDAFDFGHALQPHPFGA